MQQQPRVILASRTLCSNQWSPVDRWDRWGTWALPVRMGCSRRCCTALSLGMRCGCKWQAGVLQGTASPHTRMPRPCWRLLPQWSKVHPLSTTLQLQVYHLAIKLISSGSRYPLMLPSRMYSQHLRPQVISMRRAAS
jgi:hypothetical protein